MTVDERAMMERDEHFERWLAGMPKAELHLHIDGSLQAERMLSLAEKNGVALPYGSIEEVEAACDFDDLQGFLDLYYQGTGVVRDADDFYLLMKDYLSRCREQNILHTEIMVEPQTYTARGIALETMMDGFLQAVREARAQWGQSVLLILGFLRHLPQEQALRHLMLAQPWREHFVAIGLASAESGNPPEKFEQLFRAAREMGYRAVAHAGEEGPPAYIRGALERLEVDRIDHGVRCTEDARLVEHLANRRVPLTVCPLSNVCLRVFDRLQQHNILELLDKGVMVTVNSDDPAYFGGFVNENLIALHRDLGMTREQAGILAANSFEASFLPAAEKAMYLQRLRDYCETAG